MIFKTIIKRIFKITLTTNLNLWLMIGTFATDVLLAAQECIMVHGGGVSV